jgi:hypothetical protein
VNAKTLERIHILRTILALDDGKGVHAIVIADQASAVCDHPLLVDAPALSRRGIGQKLNAMSLTGLVDGVYDPYQRLMVWSVTDKGCELAASLPSKEGRNDG